MSCGIYCIENKINHKKYVGQSIDIKSRWTQHRHTSSLVRDTFLYRAMDKYGVENFDFYILEECQPDELDIKEIYWIATLDTYNYGYNMTLGGSGLAGYKAYNRNCIPKNFGMLSNNIDETVPIIKLDTDYEVLEYYVSVQDCARANGIASTNISKTASGKNNTCHGYIFMYFNDIKDMTTDEIISYRLHQRKNYKWTHPVHEVLTFLGDKENIITIDNEGDLCLDDALSISDNKDGTYTLFVHLANPASIIPYTSSTMKEALKRCNTLYLLDDSICQIIYYHYYLISIPMLLLLK